MLITVNKARGSFRVALKPKLAFQAIDLGKGSNDSGYGYNHNAKGISAGERVGFVDIHHPVGSTLFGVWF